MAEIDRGLAAGTLEDGRAIATDDSSKKPALLQSQGERSANQAGTDDRDLANGHALFSPQRHGGTEKAEGHTRKHRNNTL